MNYDLVSAGGFNHSWPGQGGSTVCKSECGGGGWGVGGCQRNPVNHRAAPAFRAAADGCRPLKVGVLKGSVRTHWEWSRMLQHGAAGGGGTATTAAVPSLLLKFKPSLNIACKCLIASLIRISEERHTGKTCSSAIEAAFYCA